MTAINVDLSNCDQELIHIPQLIQPHGIMLVLRRADRIILQASENTKAVFGISAPNLHLKGLSALLGAAQAAELGKAIIGAGDRLNGSPLLLLRMPPARGRQALDVIAHIMDDVLILELEHASETSTAPIDFQTKLIPCIARLHATRSLQDFLDTAVTQIRAFTGFDRVMAYRFAQDGSGEVVAEARQAGAHSYLGQHFPASDIPAPARRLFALSLLRHLPDVDYVPVALLPEMNEPVDMSRAILRHVSVMYSSYLKNMRVRSTMVMPIMKAGRLWGLISCMHHSMPLHVPSETRIALELLGVLTSLTLAEKDDLDTAVYRSNMKEAIKALVGQMVHETIYHRGLSEGPVTLLGWLDAPGAALVTESGLILFGNTPTEEEVRGIVTWLGMREDAGAVFATDRLSELHPPADAFRATAAGVLAARLMRSGSEFIMWFRPQIIRVTEWAGDPNKPVQVDVVDGKARLTPRGSFELWKESMSGRSEPWLDCEIEAAGDLRQAITEEVLIQLNDDLRRSNVELDSFAYAASHDLKEPLRGIHNFARFLQHSAGPKLTSEEQGRIQTIIRLTRRMDDLTDVLLEYSRVGQADFVMETVDLNDVLSQALDVLETRIIETGTVVSQPRPLPKVQSSPAPLGTVYGNLISNALKYNDLPAGERQIEIGWRDDRGGRIFYVRDNGIGIAERHLEHVFRIFRRLHGRDEYGGGSGAGLTIARRIIERLGGRLWAESGGVGKGTTFLFRLGRTQTEPMQS